jgi:hypothetical protein
MSGWIKIEKDLETDPRVRRIAKGLGNAHALHGVTLVIGALTRLWMHADSHARSDDSLDMSPTEIDDWLGIPGFCDLLPEEWLLVLPDGSVELPGFQTHNGTEAKKKALTQKRVTRHRNNVKRTSVTTCNGSALPDQTKTRPDQTILREEGTPSRAKRSTSTRLSDDFALTPERRAIAQAESIDPERTFAKFRDYWLAAAGAKARKLDWDATWRNWCRSEADRKPTPNGHDPPRRKTRFEIAMEGLNET